MTCETYTPLAGMNTDTVTGIEQLRQLAAKYDATDRVFVKVSTLRLLIEGIDLLQSAINFEMSHGHITRSRAVLDELQK